MTALRSTLVSYHVITSGYAADLRIVYTDADGSLHCDVGECIDGAWRWRFATTLPQDVEEAAGNALLNWPHRMPGFAGCETAQEAADEAEHWYSRDVGPDPVLRMEAR